MAVVASSISLTPAPGSPLKPLVAAFDSNVEQAIALFGATFGSVPRAALTIASAPGRVNLIGEHTDYNDGFVMPLALDLSTVIVGTRAPAGVTRSQIVSAKFPGEVVEFSALAGDHAAPGLPAWGNYVKGVTAMYLRHTGLENLAVRVAIVSLVPFGSGLSSSAALEVSFATFLESAFGLQISKTQKALLCQKAEHEYCNVPCGIMDQFISSCGQQQCALLIDCRTQESTPVAFDDPDVVIVVSNSNVNHELSGSEYKDRVAQCKAAVAALQTRNPEISHLRDATMAQLLAVQSELPDVVFRRARHVISENERTLETVACIQSKRYEDAGQHMFASHASLRNDYEVSTPELDALVEIARKSPGVYGARMTGGGFGGCIVVLLRRANAPELLAKLGEGYPPELGAGKRQPTSFITKIGQGASVLQTGAVTP